MTIGSQTVGAGLCGSKTKVYWRPTMVKQHLGDSWRRLSQREGPPPVLNLWTRSESGFERTLTRDLEPQIKAREVARSMAGRERVLVIGIGGSSAGAKAILDAVGDPGQRRRLQFLDNLDKELLDRTLEGVESAKLGVFVISRSGQTLEVLALLREVFTRHPKAQYVLISHALSSPLRSFADEHGWSQLPIPADVGGRFSVFTPAGLAPLAAVGIDVGTLLQGAKDADPVLARTLAVDLQRLAEQGFQHHLQFLYGDRLRSLGEWWVQLVGESLGKEGLGVFPQWAIGTRDQHSILQLLAEGPKRSVMLFVADEDAHEPPADGPDFGRLGPQGLTELRHILWYANAKALDEMGRPVTRFLLDRTPASVGAWMQTWMRATADLGQLMGINAFDQPGVEAGKIVAAELLSASAPADGL